MTLPMRHVASRIEGDMIWTAVYTSPPGADGRAAAILEAVATALAASGEVERRGLDRADAAPTLPGLARIEGHQHVVALGLEAHVALADLCKTSLIAGCIETELRADDLAALVWSCTNAAAVALGAAAWRSVQLLPFRSRRVRPVPPLRLGAGEGRPDHVLVIDHEVGTATARALVELLGRDLPEITYLGRPGSADATGSAWSGRAGTHVHVGHHRADGDGLRLIDSWHSGCPALHLVPPTARPGLGDLHVTDGIDGFTCHAADTVRARLAELLGSRVLRRMLAAAGLRAAAPLAQGWATVAGDLLASGLAP